jgi:hypothetical protein
MSKRPARFTLKEVQTLVKAAQEAGTRLILELERDGTMRIVLNEEGDRHPDIAAHRDYVL